MPVNVKSERVDPQYYNQGYYGNIPGQPAHMPVFGTQYGSHIGNNPHMDPSQSYQQSQGQPMGNQNLPLGSTAVGQQPQAPVKPPVQPSQEEEKDDFSENQIDFASIKGVFGWDTVDGVNIPYIFRKEKKYVSVRVVEMKLLSKYPNSYPDDLGKHQPLTSYFITPNEARLLNEINTVHCGCEYGQKPFGTKDLIVLLEDFERFYNIVKKTFPDNDSQQKSPTGQEFDRSKMTQMCGWLQLNNTVSPFVKRPDGKYVPLSVIRYAAGLLLEVDVEGSLPSETECELLNKACKVAGFNFSFGKTTRIISLTEIMKHCGIHITELPFDNPLQHAHYMELPTSQPEPQKSCPVPQPPVQNQMVGPQHQGFPTGMSPHLTAAYKQVQDKFPENMVNNNRMPTPGMPPPMDPRYASMFMFGRNSMWPNTLYGCGMPTNTAMTSMNNCVPPNVALRPPHVNNTVQMYGMPPQYMQNGQMVGDHGAPVRNMTPSQGNMNRAGPSQSPSRSASVGSNSSGQMNRTSPAMNPISHSPMGLQPSPTTGVRQQMSPPGLGRPPMSPVSGIRTTPQGTSSMNMNQGVPQGTPPHFPGTSNNMAQFHGHSIAQTSMATAGPMFGPQQSRSIQQALQCNQPRFSYSHPPAMAPIQMRPASQQRFPSQAPPNPQPLMSPNHEQVATQSYPHRPPSTSIPSGPLSSVSAGQMTRPEESSALNLALPTNNIQSLSPNANGPSHRVPGSTSPESLPPPPLIAAPVSIPMNIYIQQPTPTGITLDSNEFDRTSTSESRPIVREPESRVTVSDGSLEETETQLAPATAPVPAVLSDKDPNSLISALVASIQGVWLNEKSISCMHLNTPTRKGKYCLVEAVGKLFFNGVSVSEFLFALQNVLDVPLPICNDDEEKAFIQYYSLPVLNLKCNKMIDLKDLESFYPQLSYMFPDKSSKSSDSPEKRYKDMAQTNSNQVATTQPNEAEKTSAPASVSAQDNSSILVAIPIGTLESLEPPGADVRKSSGDHARPFILGKRPSVVVTGGPAAKQPCKKLEGTIQKLWNQAETGPSEMSADDGSEAYQVAESGVIVLD